MAYLDRTTKKIHVMPDDNTHACLTLCYCKPFLSYMDEGNGGEVWDHRGDEFDTGWINKTAQGDENG
jgi:hypothetical protein